MQIVRNTISIYLMFHLFTRSAVQPSATQVQLLIGVGRILRYDRPSSAQAIASFLYPRPLHELIPVPVCPVTQYAATSIR
jgi:hypothetical protein